MSARTGALTMDDESANVVQRFREGDPDAAIELHDRYANRLIALARLRISSKLARRVDAEDIVQSVYRSFFAHVGDGRFVFERSGDLWRLLSSITINKVLQQVQKHRRKKRSIDLEKSVSGDGAALGISVEMLTREPSPSVALAMIEEMEKVMSELDPLQRRILEMRLQGRSTEQIAGEISRSERTVRRMLEKIRTTLENRLLDATNSD